MQADVYSFGVMLWEIVTGIAPVRGGLSDVSVPDDCPAAISDLIKVCATAQLAPRVCDGTARPRMACLHGPSGAASPAPPLLPAHRSAPALPQRAVCQLSLAAMQCKAMAEALCLWEHILALVFCKTPTLPRRRRACRWTRSSGRRPNAASRSSARRLPARTWRRSRTSCRQRTSPPRGP